MRYITTTDLLASVRIFQKDKPDFILISKDAHEAVTRELWIPPPGIPLVVVDSMESVRERALQELANKKTIGLMTYFALGIMSPNPIEGSTEVNWDGVRSGQP